MVDQWILVNPEIIKDMGNSCQYCANSDTKLDHFGYCIKYGCLETSGKKEILDRMVKQASALWFGDSSGQVSGPVSNFYSKNHRKADDLKYDAYKEFGFIPYEIFDKMPEKYRHEKWDKNIRW